MPIPSPPPPTPTISLTPGTRELQDGQVVADRVAQGQLQTYHFAIAQSQSLPVRRQLERIIFHPGAGAASFQKRQAPGISSSSSSSSLPSSGSSSVPTSSTAVPAPTRTIAPILPSPLPNGTYAVFISVSTCSAPRSGADVCPPLVMYVSTSASQPLPGPGQDPKTQMVTSNEGLIQFTTYTDKEIFFSLQAPSLQGTWTGDWAVEVGASSQGYVQRYQDSQGLVLDDTDSTSASFLTHNFTAVPTFKVYLINSTSLPVGLTHSLCAIDAIQPVPLTKANMIVTQTNRTSNLDGSMGTLILPPEPTFEEYGQRRQVLIQALTPGTNYTAFFITDVLNQAGAEEIYAMTVFRTKRHDNCVLITDLQFCQEVAYAVPITPQSTLPGGGGAANSTVHQDIKHFYDDFTSNLMDNFQKVLGQYDCSKSQYSLIRNCTDCTRAYRRWLCSVSIPRCTDVEDVMDTENNLGYVAPTADPNTAQNPYLIDRTNGPVIVERNTNTSRGAIAQLSQNSLMNPGDYGEVLPCIDLCFDVVQSCPNFLEFNCPVKNMAGNYAHMNSHGYRCNGLGLVPVPSSGSSFEREDMGMMRVVVGAAAALVIGGVFL
ncbi:stretch-activated Ca2+-permeable channel component-domain-containing protein [Gamsiella multidivaricata]|uniref:stretch-activated Ca2+-permeable channel component-domain-containing protein n=1 Tax=Gamsiella multidivaricata TaxID=101098 RepID=UPI00221FB904|nr:stretch-activated Ca2+-permeable channel component-domain-containing protein [Gamsiella multidivaricata]KAG0354390.1 stretch-activated cation channel mid1 [Gamsiella multidivaricata]KAI7832336.1 stretch-activated Ca2+-permeable channel component-domain-containing protein [Gamsiella multidivaricata]